MLTFLEKYRFEFAAFVLTAAALFINPYYFGVSDHTYKIPFLQMALDPSLYPRDITVAMHKFYVSFFYVPVYPLVKFFGYETAFLLIYGFSCALFFAAVYKISKKLFGTGIVGVLSVMLLFSAKNAGGGVWTIDFIVEERFTASAILLFSVYHLISARPALAGILFGLAANIHLVSAVNFALFILLFSLESIARPFGPKRAFGREFLSFCFFAGLFTLPVVIKKIMCGGEGLAVFVDPEWMRMIMLRSSHHFAADYPFIFNQCAFWALSFFILARMDVLKDQPLVFRVYASAAAAMMAGGVLALVFSIPFPFLMGLCLSFFRSGYLFVVLSYMAASFIFLNLFSKNVFSACACAVFFSCLPLEFQLIVLAGFAVYLSFQKKPLQSVPQVPSGRQLVLLVFLFLLFAGALRYSRPLITAPDPALKAAQLWVNQNTEKDALILMPPTEEDFRVFSGRSTAGSWKDWTYNVLDRKFAFEMQERLKDFCGISADVCKTRRPCWELCKKNYAKLNEARIGELVKKYGIDFIVRQSNNPLNLEMVYQNQKYLIYKAPAL